MMKFIVTETVLVIAGFFMIGIGYVVATTLNVIMPHIMPDSTVTDVYNASLCVSLVLVAVVWSVLVWAYSRFYGDV